MYGTEAICKSLIYFQAIAREELEEKIRREMLIKRRSNVRHGSW